jgi:hypothetical protein
VTRRVRPPRSRYEHESRRVGATTLDFANAEEFGTEHYAFHVDDQELDEILATLRARFETLRGGRGGVCPREERVERERGED